MTNIEELRFLETFENKLVKFYWTPLTREKEINWQEVDGTQDFSIIPTDTKGQVKGLEIGMLRDIVQMAYRTGLLQGKKAAEKARTEAIIDEIEQRYKDSLGIGENPLVEHLRSKFLNNL